MIRGEVVRLFPTPEQEKMFRECIGYARFSYNYCKSYDDEYVKTNSTRLSAFDLAKVLVKLKYTEGYEWMQSLPSDIAKQAMENLGIKPLIKAIRGGTDGSKISFMGLPTPNIFAGGENFHGKYEFVALESMEKATDVIVEIAKLNAER